MYTIKTTGQFKKDVRRCQKRGYDMSLLRNAQPDWLLIWKKYGKTLTLTMTDTGTHSDLYG